MSGLEELLEATIRNLEKFVEIYKEKPVETLLFYHLTMRTYDVKIDRETLNFLNNRKRETTEDLIKLFDFMKENGLIISGEILEETLNLVKEMESKIKGTIRETETNIIDQIQQGFDGVNKGINNILHKLDTYRSYFGKINEELKAQKAALELIQTSLQNMPTQETIDTVVTVVRKMNEDVQNLNTSVEEMKNGLQDVQSVVSSIENSVKNIHKYFNIENYENIEDYINKEVIPKLENVENEVKEIRKKVNEIESIINKVNYRIPDNLKETIDAYNKTLNEIETNVKNIYNSLVQNYGKGKKESSNINGISDIGKEYNQKERK